MDRNLTAKIGFTQELPSSVHGHTMVTASALAKSLGYCPPEMDTCHHSPKSDVYSYGVVVLETFSGKPAYMKDRDDPILTEHLDDQRKSIDEFKTIADPKTHDELAHYLMALYYKIIEQCLLKHRLRPESEKVMQWWNETNF